MKAQLQSCGLAHPVTIPTPNTHSTVVASVGFCPYSKADFVNPAIAATSGILSKEDEFPPTGVGHRFHRKYSTDGENH